MVEANGNKERKGKIGKRRDRWSADLSGVERDLRILYWREV